MRKVNKSINAPIKILLSKLKYRERTEKEAVSILEKKDISAEIITKVIDYFKEIGYIDDTRFIRSYINDNIKLKKKSVNLIIIELKKKGLDETKIETVLNEIQPDEFSTALTLAEKKKKRYSGFERDLKIKKKFYNYLSSKGFNSSIIMEVLNKLAEKVEKIVADDGSI